MKHAISSLATTLALVGSTHAATIVDNFESYVYDPVNPVDMNNQGGWVVTNGTPANFDDGPVVIVDNYTWDGSARSATVGGITPDSSAVTSLSHAASVPLPNGSFSFETSYTESTNQFRNPFSFVLGTDAGPGNLLAIYFTPGAAGNYDVAWDSDFDLAPATVIGSKAENNSTQFQLDTFWNGSAVVYNFSNAGTPVSSGTFNTLTNSNSMNRFSANWDSTVGRGVGNNSITIDNVKMTNRVPDGGTTLLLLGSSMAGLGLLRRTGNVITKALPL